LKIFSLGVTWFKKKHQIEGGQTGTLADSIVDALPDRHRSHCVVVQGPGIALHILHYYICHMHSKLVVLGEQWFVFARNG